MKGIQCSRGDAEFAEEYKVSREGAKALSKGILSSRGDAGNDMDVDEVTGIVIDEAMKIHKGLGPGLLESVYEMVLAKRLNERGLHVQCQRKVSFEYEGLFFDEGFRCDMLVEQKVVVELKSVESLHPVHKKQILTYLRLMKLNVGLLINFGAPILKEGLHRIVNNYTPSATLRLRVNISPSFSANPASLRDQKGLSL